MAALSSRPRRAGSLRVATALLTLAWLALAAPRVHADVPGRSTYPVGATPNACALADLDGDARLDLVVTNYSSNTVTVYFGGPDGFAGRADYAVGANPTSVAVGDVNGDSHPDLAVANSRATTITIWLGNGSGQFAGRSDVALGGMPAAVVLGDWNMDGELDLAATVPTSNAVYVMRGDGLGHFSQRRSTSVFGSMPQALAAGDLDGDGHSDLVVASGGSTCVSVLVGDGEGAFDTYDFFTTGAAPGSIALADLNHDGRLDVVTANGGANSLSILLADASGFPASRTDVPLGAVPSAIATADLDANGHPDLLVSTSSTSSVLEFVGDGTGAFSLHESVTAGAGASGLASGSLDGDVLGDFVVANGRDNTVLAVRGRSPGVLTIASSPNPSRAGDTTRLTATLTPGTATGTVSFFEGGTLIAAGSLVSGVATAYPIFRIQGTHVLTAYYPGGELVGPTTSATLTHVVGPANAGRTSTTTTLTLPAAEVDFGPLVHLVATVSPDTATGTVRFQRGTTLIGTANLDHGTAAIDVSLAAGVHDLLATYTGDPNYDGSVSSSASLTVRRASFAISLAVSPTPSVYTQSVTLTVTGFPAWATGLVTFVDGTSTLGSASVGAGTASNAFRSLTIGTHTLAAVYSGDGNDAGARSPDVTHRVDRTPSAVTLSTSTIQPMYGDSITFVAVVTRSIATAPPTGTVQFRIDGANAGPPVVLVPPTPAELRTTLPSRGAHVIVAEYSGSETCAPSVSSPLALFAFDAHPMLRSVRDVPGDQGRLVRLTVEPSGYDRAGSIQPISRYAVFRRIDGTAPAFAAAPTSPHVAGWDQVGGFDAFADTLYTVVVPTLADSSDLGVHRATYFVRAVGPTPTAWFDSAPDSGCSVDNLPPASPAPFVAVRFGDRTELHWGANAELDFACYRLYRGAAPDFVPTAATLLAQPVDTSWVDRGDGGAYYKLSAVDQHGGESACTSALAGLAPPGSFALALEPVRPNPHASGPLTVRFTLASAAPVRLELLDVAGRRVASLGVAGLERGAHELEVPLGAVRASGLYFVRLVQDGSVRTTRVAIVR